MRTSTKLLALFLTFMMVLGLAPTAFAAGEPTIRLTASSESVKAGDEVSITVSLENNPGFACMLLHVDYDSDAFEIVSVSDERAVSGAMHSNDYLLDPYTLFWFNGTTTKDITVNGNIVTINFEVLEDAMPGECEFDIFYDNANAEIITWMLEPVEFEVASATVSVEGSITETEAPETDAPETEAPETDAPETVAPETDKKDDKDDDDDRENSRPSKKDDDDYERPNVAVKPTVTPTSPVETEAPAETDSPAAPAQPEAAEAVSGITLKSETELAAWQNPFSDVKESDWYYNAVRFSSANGVMNGLSDDLFAPMGDVTRAMFVTMLYRIEKEPDTAASSFADIDAGSWYEKAVSWASANGLVNGVTESEFAPNALITREQMAAIIYRYASYKKTDTSARAELKYTDADTVSDYASEPLSHAVGSGLITGTSQDTLSPKANATRAQAATILMRMLELWYN